jgi:hypothetical protein
MGLFYGAATLRERRASCLPIALPCPEDFRETFVSIGRAACEYHYSVGRATVTRWIEETGRAELVEERTARVKEQRKLRRRRPPPGFEKTYIMCGPKECARLYRVDRTRTMARWLDELGRDRILAARARETGKRLNRVDMNMLLAKAFPLNPK